MEQQTIDYLLSLEKEFKDFAIIFPGANEKISLEAISVDRSESFHIDINRTGTLRLTYATFQERYATTQVLVRLDLNDSKTHQNPDGSVITGPHIHICKEGFGDRWAYLLDDFNLYHFSQDKNLTTSFLEFCEFCNVHNIPTIQERM